MAIGIQLKQSINDLAARWFLVGAKLYYKLLKITAFVTLIVYLASDKIIFLEDKKALVGMVGLLIPILVLALVARLTRRKPTQHVIDENSPQG